MGQLFYFNPSYKSPKILTASLGSLLFIFFDCSQCLWENIGVWNETGFLFSYIKREYFHYLHSYSLFFKVENDFVTENKFYNDICSHLETPSSKFETYFASNLIWRIFMDSWSIVNPLWYWQPQNAIEEKRMNSRMTQDWNSKQKVWSISRPNHHRKENIMNCTMVI